jgi:type I restriction enzyme S subunit
MSWRTVPLYKVANLESGFGFPREYQGDENQECPFFRVSDMNIAGNEVFMENHSNTVSAAILKELGARAFPAGTVIFPKIGAAIATEKKRILTKPATYDNNVMGAVPKVGTNPKFLYYWFLQLKLSDQANPGHVPSIRKSVMEEIPFPVVAPTEQLRIVELLDEADRLRRIRREADAKAVRILPALFLKMFGDPATNPKGMPVKLLGDPAVCDINPRTRAGLADSDLVSFVPMADVDEVLGRITGHQSRLYGEVRKGFTPFRERDVLFAKITPCMQNGKAAIASGLIGGFGFGSTEFHVLRAGLDVTPEYLFALVRLQSFKNHAMSAFTGSAGQQRVPTEFLRQFSLPVPTSTDLQKFSSVIRHLLAYQIETEHAADKLAALFQLLLQRAFSGQLTAKWREGHIQELLAEMAQQARALNLPMREELEALS